MKLVILALSLSIFALSSCAEPQKYEEGKFMIWSGRGAILTAQGQSPASSWQIPNDPPINERVEVVKKSDKSDDRLLQAPNHLTNPDVPHIPNFLSDEEVQTLSKKALVYEVDTKLEQAARVWEYLAADRPDNAEFSFNAAKAWARLGDADLAAKAARQAWKRGINTLDSYKLDVAFADIARTRVWSSMLIEFEVRSQRQKD